MVHLGIDFDPRPFVHGVCTYYYGTYDIEGGLAEAREGIYHEGEKGFVVHIPSLVSPEMAPPGQHVMTIYTSVRINSTRATGKSTSRNMLINY